MVTLSERMSRFLEKEPANDKERLTKVLLDDRIVPFYTLTEDGSVDSSLFLQTDLSKRSVLNYIKAQATEVKISLRKGIFATSNEQWPGFWVEFKEV